MLLQINTFSGCCNTLDRRKEILEFDRMRERETTDMDQLKYVKSKDNMTLVMKDKEVKNR